MADAALISGLLSNLAPLIQDEFSLFWSFKKKVQKLFSTLSSISAVLEDAERKNVQEKDKQMEDWLRKLKDVAYEVRGIMDECTFEDLRLQVNRRNASSSTLIQVTNSITHPFISTRTRRKVGHKIKDVQEKLDQISSERHKFHLRESIPDSKIDKLTSSWRETVSLSSCNKVYGRDKEKKQIIDILVNTSTVSVAKKLSVLPIVGIGGLGKTTLVQTVFNDEEITKHFETKIWVCVSNEFDIKLVMKAILEEKPEARSEELPRKVREKLSGKRYLIVLDDVWNENLEEWDQLRSILDCGSNGAFVLTTTRKRNVAKIMETIQHFELSLLSQDDCWLLFEERAFICGTPKTPNFVDIGKEIAKKCMGVPLIVKTLGSQLGFKNNLNEWAKIRDSEIWENEESDLLPILRLSYYDLPYHLRRCFVFCAIFPKDAEIEKERLIQLWMAHDLIPMVKNQEVEDIGNRIWNELRWRSFFQDEKLDRSGLYEICKIEGIMHDFAQSVRKDECYTLDANSSSDGFKREIRHVAVMVDKFVKTLVGSLKKIGGLQSLMLNGTDVDGKQIFLSVLKEFPALRVLELSCDVSDNEYFNVIINNMNESKKYPDLRYVGCLKHLRYLDISGNSQITTLPDSICDLLNLQTLKLNECFKLESLPRNTKDLISLRHLYLENCNELKYMPKGMGQLKHLKTLSLFVISNKERYCQLDELKELDIGGYLKIKNLGSVTDASKAREVSMAKMKSISELELEWRTIYEDDESKSTRDRDEKIGEALDVSTARLKKLKMSGYKGVNLPKWAGKACPSLTRLELKGLDNVNIIAISSDDNVLFPLLEELVVVGMKTLRELVSPSCTGAFPNLSTLVIWYCPELGALPPHLKSLKDVTVIGECSNELLNSIWDLNGTLTHLNLNELNNDVEHIFTVNNNSINGIEVVLFPLLEELKIGGMKNLRELVSPTIPSSGAFPNLSSLRIFKCPKLGALPPHLKSLKDVYIHGECSDELIYSIWNLSALTHLTFIELGERSVLFRGVRSAFQSLQSLSIERCPKLRRLFDEGIIMQETFMNRRTRGLISSLTELISSNTKICCCQNKDFMNSLTELIISNTKIGDCQNKVFMNSLTGLDIRNCPELMISLEEFEHLNIHNPLRRLYIRRCPKLVSSEEADGVKALLRSLRNRLYSENFDVDIKLEVIT